MLLFVSPLVHYLDYHTCRLYDWSRAYWKLSQASLRAAIRVTRTNGYNPNQWLYCKHARCHCPPFLKWSLLYISQHPSVGAESCEHLKALWSKREIKVSCKWTSRQSQAGTVAIDLYSSWSWRCMLGKQHGTFLNVKKEKCLEHDFQEIESTTFTLFHWITNRSLDLIL